MSTVRFRFDRRIPEEAALMDRLGELPEDRHIEYIRNLAVRGFLEERAESSNRKFDRTVPHAGSERHADPQVSKNSPEPKIEPIKTDAQLAEVPADLTLASLKQLVG